MHTDRIATPTGASLRVFLDIGRAAFAWMARCFQRARQRHALAALDERLLRDIGHDRVEVAREVTKPFWRD